jgi:hypothetical protein
MLDEKLTLKITNKSGTNLHECVERIIQDYITEQTIEDRTSLDTIKDKFYMELHDRFLCTIPKLLHNFLPDKGIGNIVEF